MFADVSKEALTKRRILVNIESLVFVIELLISFINCAPEVASSISKQWAVKKKKKKKNAYLFQYQDHSSKMDSQYLDCYVSIYAHASDLEQDVVLCGIWFLCNCDN